MVDSFINPLFQYKMALLDGTVASTGLFKPKTMSDYLNKQAAQYSEAYFPFDPREKEGAQFTPWSNSKTCLLDGRSSTSHLSGMEGKQHMFLRQNGNSSKEGTPQLSPLHAAPVKQGFTLYGKSPEVSSSSAAPSVKQGFTLYSKSPEVGSSSAATSAAVGKPRTGGEDPSPQSGSPIFLAVPKPVYGHSPCCGELCCVRGRYCVESGFPRVPHPLYAQYSESSAAQKKAQDALLQHRGLQFDAGADRLKGVDTYGPGRERPLPSIVNPNYSGYPCTFYGSFGKQGQQTSPGAYPNLFPSHHTYEHMTSEVYQEHSPMTKYGHVTQHPVFYYSQADVEVENRSQCKNSGSKPREDGPVTVKHALPPPQEHFVVPRPLHAEAPLPHFQHHALLQGFGYPCYGGPRFNVGVRQSLQPSPAGHVNNVHFPPSNLCPDYHIVSSARLHEDGARLGVGRLDANSSFLRVDQSNPPRYSNQPVGPAPAVAVNRLFHPNRPDPQMPGLNVTRFLPYSPSGGQVRCPDPPSVHPVALGSPLHPSLHHYPDQIGKAAHDLSSVRANVSSSVKTESKPHHTTSSLSLKRCLKRSLSQPSPPVNIKEERDSEEPKPLKQCKKMEEAETAWVRSATDSPPMPVIDSVFSLAPYRAHAQPPGATLPGGALHAVVQPEDRAVQMQRKDQGVDRPPVCRASKEIYAGSPAQTPPEGMLKPQDIKVEKDASDDFAESAPDQRDGPVMALEAGPPGVETLVVIKKCEPEELEVKPLAVKTEAADRSNPADSSVQRKPSPQSNAEVARQPKPSAPPQPAESGAGLKNVHPCSLKLSTYNIVLPSAESFSPAPAPKKPSAPPPTTDVPNLDVHLPVRKHFYELHHSLYKLISKSVFATSEQELRNLLSQLELAEILYPSSKIKNMSSLLGVKPRELWFNEEVKSVFHELLKRLNEYTTQERCPFPHIMRTSAVFLPMLVLKELLFPMVQSSFIDQVLQEHRVELRPTTLSEEKILLQLHKRACSSRLRKLMSLKHLPDIYADMVNILFYTCISKHLESTSPDAKKKAKVYGVEVETRVKDEVFEVTIGGDAASPASPASPAELCSSPPPKKKERKGRSFLAHSKTKSRIKSSSRRLFLDESLSDEGEAAETDRSAASGRGARDGERDRADAKRDAAAAEASWMCPLNFEDVPPGAHAASAIVSKSRSGVVLKLRRTFSTSLNRKKARYQAVSDSRTLPDRPPPRAEDGEADGRASKLTPRWQRAPSFCRALAPIGGSSKRSLLKIKYCPYLSACDGADRRRRWVLRSAVQRAGGAHYPDLVGKRIRHLYEEDDKSEVWYRGEVLRVHEAHANPLKTIFEVRYDSEPEWRYYLELLIDYKKGWLKVDD